MTKNQIEYNKLLETQRANMASEELTRKRDQATRELGLDQLRETARHNQQVELQARDNLAEQYRNNLAQLQELQRSHLASEGIARQNADTNTQIAQESKRHNVASEALSEYSTSVNQLGAELGASSRERAAGISAAASQYASDNALLAKQLDIGLGRLNLATQTGLRTAELSEAKRQNFARQAEINRANRVAEGQKAVSLLQTAWQNSVTNTLNAKKINADISLRQDQNSIARTQTAINRDKVNADISLVPSQRFSNVARGVGGLTPLIAGLAGA